MMELLFKWRETAKELRKRAGECNTDEARERMIAEARAVENCASELFQAYLNGAE